MIRPRTGSRLGTAVLLLVILVLGFLVAVGQIRETRLKAAFEQFRVFANKEVCLTYKITTFAGWFSP
jgi:hypothetical protein